MYFDNNYQEKALATEPTSSQSNALLGVELVKFWGTELDGLTSTQKELVIQLFKQVKRRAA